MAQWGKTDTLNDSPTELVNGDDANNLFFVDTEESKVSANRAKGLKTPGWNIYEERTALDEFGNSVTRRRVESLVPMDVAAADAGDLGITGNTLDEDGTVADA